MRLNPVSHVLEIVHPDFLANALLNAMEEQSLDLVGAKEINKYYTLDYFRSVFQEAGKKISFVFQPVNSRIIPTGAHKKIVSGSVSLRNLFKKEEFNLANYVDKDLKKILSLEGNIFEENSRQFKKDVFQFVEDKFNTRRITSFSIRNEKTSEYINSYVDESDSFILGLNDFELGFLYELLVPGIKSIDYTYLINKDNIVNKLFNIDFITTTDISHAIRRSSQSTKQLFNEYLKLFKQFAEVDPATEPLRDQLQQIA